MPKARVMILYAHRRETGGQQDDSWASICPDRSVPDIEAADGWIYAPVAAVAALTTAVVAPSLIPYRICLRAMVSLCDTILYETRLTERAQRLTAYESGQGACMSDLYEDVTSGGA